MKWFLVLALGLSFGCATRLKGTLQTESEWRVKDESGMEFVFPAELKSPIELNVQKSSLVLEIPHAKLEQIRVPLQIPGPTVETAGESKYPASVVGQAYDVTVWRQEKRQIADKLMGSDHCTYVTYENRCEMVNVYNQSAGHHQLENRCGVVPIERSGRKWIQYSPVREETTILISFLKPGSETRVASFQTQEQKGSRAIWNEGQCL